MDFKVRRIRQKIENLRNEMVLTFLQNGADMRDPQVLRLSQLLDEQLNRYEQCFRYPNPASPIRETNLSLSNYKRNA